MYERNFHNEIANQAKQGKSEKANSKSILIYEIANFHVKTIFDVAVDSMSGMTSASALFMMHARAFSY